MPHLDMIRGLAALEVCLGHARGFFLVDYGQTSGGLVAKLFYAFSGLHHQAVMVFFVLSGFLVGGSVIRAHERGTWRWSGYLLRRLCRLWIVILPALVLTLLWDLYGAHLNPPAYQGAFLPQLLSGPGPTYDVSLRALLGNFFFLQTITVPAFGSNGPLWSLANEFWYYLLFPLALQAIVGAPSPTKRVAAIVLIAAIVYLLPLKILEYGLIWLFGVAAFLALHHPATGRLVARWPVGVAAGIVFVATLLASRLQSWLGNDFLIGVAFTFMVPWLASAGSRSVAYRRTGFLLSEFSYTLYLVHFPLLAWIYFSFAAPAQWPFSAWSLAALAGILGIVIAYAWMIWWVFERNTDVVRTFVSRLWPRQPGRPQRA